MTYVAAGDRYSRLPYRRCGRSGIMLPEVSLGLWQNFGDSKPVDDQRAILRRAFDLGVTHFDLANNYGPPYGDHGPRKSLLASLDQSLGRMGLEYVDISPPHRSDRDTPLEETMGALHT